MSQYDAFAVDFARTRSHPWEFLITFMKELTDQGILNQYDLGLDIGSGNGQNAVLLQKRTKISIGLDLSWMLLHKAKNKYSQLIQADLLALPFRDRIFDFGMCVAVLHHIMGQKSRQQAVIEMKRITKSGGKILVTTWRRWQARFRKTFLHEGLSNATSYFPAGTKDFGDIDIGWRDSKSHILHSRSYHLFTKGELRNLLNCFQILRLLVLGHKNSRTNYVAFLQS